jgi:uncharacterized caspase-like protein
MGATRHAVVIGNNRYPNLPSDAQLRTAVNDARAMGKALASIGFSVTRIEDAGRQDLLDRFYAFASKVKAGDVAVVFYAGHGVGIEGANYLLPQDTRLVAPGEEARLRSMGIAEAELIGELQRKARITVLVLDACRDNPTAVKTGSRSLSTGRSKGLAQPPEAAGVFALYSAGFGQTALDALGPADTSNNSVFTRVLLNHIVRTDVHLVDIVLDVRKEVEKLASTVPHQQRPAYYDQTSERIFLVQRTPASNAGVGGPFEPVPASVRP